MRMVATRSPRQRSGNLRDRGDACRACRLDHQAGVREQPTHRSAHLVLGHEHHVVDRCGHDARPLPAQERAPRSRRRWWCSEPRGVGAPSTTAPSTGAPSAHTAMTLVCGDSCFSHVPTPLTSEPLPSGTKIASSLLALTQLDCHRSRRLPRWRRAVRPRCRSGRLPRHAAWPRPWPGRSRRPRARSWRRSRACARSSTDSRYARREDGQADFALAARVGHALAEVARRRAHESLLGGDEAMKQVVGAASFEGADGVDGLDLQHGPHAESAG